MTTAALVVVIAVVVAVAVGSNGSSSASEENQLQSDGVDPAGVPDVISSETEPEPGTDLTLRDVAPVGLAIGGVLHGYDSSWNREGYHALAEREFNAVTSSWYMAYNFLPGTNGEIDSSGFEDVVDWARERDMRVHGHVLLYPSANKDYWAQFPNQQTQYRVREFITEAASARRGEVWVWVSILVYIGSVTSFPSSHIALPIGCGERSVWVPW